MPTTNPRITVMLSRRQYDVLKAISTNSKQSISSFVHELIDQSLPVLERMAETFRKIKEAQDKQKKQIADDLGQAHEALEPLLSMVMGQFDLFMSKVEGAAVGGSEALAKPAGIASEPPTAAAKTPPTNRGVTHACGKVRKAASNKGLKGVSKKKVFLKS